MIEAVGQRQIEMVDRHPLRGQFDAVGNRLGNVDELGDGDRRIADKDRNRDLVIRVIVVEAVEVDGQGAPELLLHPGFEVVDELGQSLGIGAHETGVEAKRLVAPVVAGIDQGVRIGRPLNPGGAGDGAGMVAQAPGRIPRPAAEAVVGKLTAQVTPLAGAN